MSAKPPRFENLEFIEGESWRNHPYVSDVACSDLGRVASISKKVLYKGTLTKHGYLRTSFSRRSEGYVSSMLIHRLILETFDGPSRLQVNHKNGIKHDNRYENLEYVTCQENVDHAFRKGLRRNRSVNVWNSSFDEFKILAIATHHYAGFGQSITAKKFGVSENTIKAVVAGRTYSEFGWLFKDRPRGKYGKYTERALKQGGWVINNEKRGA